MATVIETPPKVFACDRVAGLARTLENAEPLPAIFEHRRHEGHVVKAAILVERRQDFLFAADFHPIVYVERHVGVLSDRKK
jgi:hypothetical protein